MTDLDEVRAVAKEFANEVTRAWVRSGGGVRDIPADEMKACRYWAEKVHAILREPAPERPTVDVEAIDRALVNLREYVKHTSYYDGLGMGWQAVEHKIADIRALLEPRSPPPEPKP